MGRRGGQVGAVLLAWVRGGRVGLGRGRPSISVVSRTLESVLDFLFQGPIPIRFAAKTPINQAAARNRDLRRYRRFGRGAES
jgi:hypothetical protein